MDKKTQEVSKLLEVSDKLRKALNEIQGKESQKSEEAHNPSYESQNKETPPIFSWSPNGN
jgi:hypothetical protein